MSTIREILVEATGVKRGDYANTQDFLHAIVAQVNLFSNDQWDALSEPAQLYFNDMSDDVNANNKARADGKLDEIKPVRYFPDEEPPADASELSSPNGKPNGRVNAPAKAAKAKPAKAAKVDEAAEVAKTVAAQAEVKAATKPPAKTKPAKVSKVEAAPAPVVEVAPAKPGKGKKAPAKDQVAVGSLIAEKAAGKKGGKAVAEAVEAPKAEAKAPAKVPAKGKVAKAATDAPKATVKEVETKPAKAPKVAKATPAEPAKVAATKPAKAKLSGTKAEPTLTPTTPKEVRSNSRSSFTGADKIKVLGKDGKGENPYRPGSKSFVAFNHFANGPTVDAAIAAGVPRNYISFDYRAGYIGFDGKPAAGASAK